MVAIVIWRPEEAVIAVSGWLRAWVPTADGAWLGLVTYVLRTTDDLDARTTHYVPAELVTRRTPRSTRRTK